MSVSLVTIHPHPFYIPECRKSCKSCLPAQHTAILMQTSIFCVWAFPGETFPAPHSNRWLLLSQPSWAAVLPRFSAWPALHCYTYRVDKRTDMLYACPATWGEKQIKFQWAVDSPTGNEAATRSAQWQVRSCTTAYPFTPKRGCCASKLTGSRLLFLEQYRTLGGIRNRSYKFYMYSISYRNTSTFHTPKNQDLAPVCQLQAFWM